MSGIDLNRIIEALRSVIRAENQSAALHEPCFTGNEWAYVKECLDTGWVSYQGQFVNKFEAMLSTYTGIKHAVATVSGTSALHICLMSVGVEQGDEVLVPALTFVATANAVVYCGAIPHFIDSEERTLGIDPAKLSNYLSDTAGVDDKGCFNKFTRRRIKAVVAVHTFGHPVDIDPLVEVCKRFDLVLVEDAAESIGSLYKGLHTGSWGTVSALSFNGNKTVTTGGGGAILTNDEDMGRLIRHLTTTAKVPHPWEHRHDRVGYNYRMPNINAALGCAQLEQMDNFLRRKRMLADRYAQAFAEIRGIKFFTEPDFARSNYWLNVLLLEKGNEAYKNDLMELAKENNIAMRPLWTLMHRLPMYSECPRMDLSIAESLERRLINIPSSVFLSGVDD